MVIPGGEGHCIQLKEDTHKCEAEHLSVKSGSVTIYSMTFKKHDCQQLTEHPLSFVITLKSNGLPKMVSRIQISL